MSDDNQKQRLFVAIPCCRPEAYDALHDKLHEWSKNKSCKLRPVPDENLHITLAFLGMLGAFERDQVVQVMDHVLNEVSEFSIRLHGIGWFANAIWLGIKPSWELQLLVKQLNDRLMGIGFAGASNRYLPHITVARIGAGGQVNLSELSNQYENTDFGPLLVDTVNLYSSRTLPSGAEYTVSHQCKLIAASESG